MRCPTCGLEQPEAPECSRCGAPFSESAPDEKSGAASSPRGVASESGSHRNNLPPSSAVARALLGTGIILAGIIAPPLIVFALLKVANSLVMNFGRGESGLAWLTILMFAAVPALFIGVPLIGIFLSVFGLINLKKHPWVSFARPYLFSVIVMWFMAMIAVPVYLKNRERKDMVRPDHTEAEAKQSLYKAIRRSDHEVINELLDRFPQLLNGTLTEYGHQFSPLLLAFGDSDTRTAQLLIDRGADVNYKNNYGETVLHLAAERGNAEWVKIFIAKGAEVNAPNPQSKTPLHLASVGHIEDSCNTIAETLLGAGALVDARDYEGCTPLHEAVYRRRLDIVEMLIKHGAEVNARNDKGQTPLSIARETAAFHQAEKDTMWVPCGKYEKTLKSTYPNTEKDKVEWREANAKCDQEMIDLLMAHGALE